MPNPRSMAMGVWNVAGQTQSANTAISQGIPPYPGSPGEAPKLYGLDGNGVPNWPTNIYTVVRRLGIVSGSTAQAHTILRPLNYTTVSTAGAISTTSLIVTADPGVYSAAGRYKYKVGGGLSKPVNVADNAIATSDFFAVQLADGTWFFDKVAGVSGSTAITVTTTTTIPNVTGGGIPAGAVFYWFGAPADKNPQNFMVHPTFNAAVSAYTEFGDPAADGICMAFNGGDPLFFVNLNATAASTLVFASGIYAKY